MERDNPKKLSVLEHVIASLLITLFATSTLFGKILWVALIWPDQQRPVEHCWIKRNPVYNCTVILLREAELNIKEDHLCRWTTFSRKCPVRLKRWKRFNYVSTRTFRNFGISWKAHMVLLFNWNLFENVFMLNLKRK